jgi:hypothetical protein
MRWTFRDQDGLFSYISPEARVRGSHLLKNSSACSVGAQRSGPQLREALCERGASLGAAETIAERAVDRGVLSLPLERQLMDQLRYNLLYRWFVGPSADDPMWGQTTFAYQSAPRAKSPPVHLISSNLLPLVADHNCRVCEHDADVYRLWYDY